MWAASKCFWKALSFSLQRPWSNLSLRYILEVIIFLIQFGPWKFSLLIEVPLNHQASLCIQLYSNEFKSLIIIWWLMFGSKTKPSTTLTYINLFPRLWCCFSRTVNFHFNFKSVSQKHFCIIFPSNDNTMIKLSGFRFFKSFFICWVVLKFPIYV